MIQSFLDFLAMLPLDDYPPFLVYAECPPPHIRVLWGQQFYIPYFENLTPKDSKIIALLRVIRDEKIPTSVEVH